MDYLFDICLEYFFDICKQQWFDICLFVFDWYLFNIFAVVGSGMGLPLKVVVFVTLSFASLVSPVRYNLQPF